MVELALDESYILFSPDAVESGVSFKMLQYLIQYQEVKPIRFKYISMDGLTLEGLYGYQLAKLYPNWWLIQKLFQMGRSMVVLVHGKQKGYSSLAERLTSLKGSADPSSADPSSLRAIFEAENRLVNFVHTPDNQAMLTREWKLFFGTRDLTLARQQHRCIYFELLNEQVQYSSQLLGFYPALSRLKCRLLALILQDSINDVPTFIQSLLKEQHYIRSIDGRVTASKELGVILREQVQLWRTLQIEHLLMNFLDQLIMLPFMKKIDLYTIYKKLEANWGPVVTDWEKLTIQSAVAVPSQMYFFETEEEHK